MVVKKVKLLTRLKQAKGNESEQINRERLHDSETLKKTGWEDAMHTTLTEFELSVGAVRPLLNTLFCMWAWQLNLLLALPAKQA